MLLVAIRLIFVVVVAGLAARMAQVISGANAPFPALWFVGTMVIATLVLLADLLIPRKKIQNVSGVYFGLIVGLILSSLMQTALEPTFQLMRGSAVPTGLLPVLAAALTVVICYACVSLVLQTKDDFRFLIPYVEFSKEVKGSRPLVLDTSVIIDGRIADVAEAQMIDQVLVEPRSS